MLRALTILAAVAALGVSAAPASAFDSQTRPYTDGLAVANHTEGTVSFRPRRIGQVHYRDDPRTNGVTGRAKR